MDFERHQRILFHPKMIAVEGNDGVGKTTFIDVLQNKLINEYGVDSTLCKEPATAFAKDAVLRTQEITDGIEDKNRLETLMVLQDITAYRARMHFSTAAWLDMEECGPRRFAVFDRTWWSTIAYQYTGLGIDADQAVHDHLNALVHPDRCNGLVHLPGHVIFITDGQDGDLAYERIKLREKEYDALEDVDKTTYKNRERTYRKLLSLDYCPTTIIVNDYDDETQWRKEASRKIDILLKNTFKLISD